jgi:hypothetical protein
MIDHRTAILTTTLHGISVRCAEPADWEAITALRLAFYTRTDRPMLDRGLAGYSWFVGVHDRAPGRVLAALSWRDVDEGLRYIFDFVRDETRVATIRPAIALARWAMDAARIDDVTLVGMVDRRNPAYEEILLATGEWEAVSTLYQMKERTD